MRVESDVQDLKLHTHRKLDNLQVDLKRKTLLCRTFAEPSDGLELSTPSLPSRAIASDAPSPANRVIAGRKHASRDGARVVSDVSVLCPRSGA
jgi:hypothetical protein